MQPYFRPWPDLPDVMFHISLGYVPYLLMFGKQPIDSVLKGQDVIFFKKKGRWKMIGRTFRLLHSLPLLKPEKEQKKELFHQEKPPLPLFALLSMRKCSDKTAAIAAFTLTSLVAATIYKLAITCGFCRHKATSVSSKDTDWSSHILTGDKRNWVGLARFHTWDLISPTALLSYVLPCTFIVCFL